MQIEGITYDIKWDAFQKGTSFTVVCLDADEARRVVAKRMDGLGIKVFTKVIVEDDVRKLRVWRIG